MELQDEGWRPSITIKQIVLGIQVISPVCVMLDRMCGSFLSSIRGIVLAIRPAHIHAGVNNIILHLCTAFQISSLQKGALTCAGAAE